MNDGIDDEKRKRLRRLIDLDMDRTDPVSVQRYTRKGNLKRPGTGIRHPNSLAALDRHRAPTQFGGSKTRRCRYCKRFAVRELEVCYWHGGKGYLRVKRRNQGKGAVGKTSDIAMRNVRRVIYEGGLPGELMHNPLFQSVGRVALPKLFGMPKGSYEPDVGRRISARILVREFIAAWYAQQDGDYKPWLMATTKARELGFGR